MCLRRLVIEDWHYRELICFSFAGFGFRRGRSQAFVENVEEKAGRFLDWAR